MATNFLESDDDMSEFEGFTPSDIGSDIHVSDVSSESEESSDNDISDEENNNEWTRNFTDVGVSTFSVCLKNTTICN